MDDLLEPIYLKATNEEWALTEREWIAIDNILPVNGKSSRTPKRTYQAVDLSMYNGSEFIKRKLTEPSTKYQWTESLDLLIDSLVYNPKGKATRRYKKNSD